MFTGIIADQALVSDIEEHSGGVRFCFGVNAGFLDDCGVGDSIAVSGVCLTVVELEKERFSADVSVETLDKTTLGSWREGSRVNLEKSLRAADRLGGHIVSGHVDGIASLDSRITEGNSCLMKFDLGVGLARFIASKGSVCIDGISLTVNDVRDISGESSQFSVCIIPHTLQVTTLGELETGDRVNIEVDMMARYLERLQEEKN